MTEFTTYNFIPTNKLEIPDAEFEYYFQVADQDNIPGTIGLLDYFEITENESAPFLIESENEGSRVLQYEWIKASITDNNEHLRVEINENETPYARQVKIQVISEQLFHTYEKLEIKQLPQRQ